MRNVSACLLEAHRGANNRIKDYPVRRSLGSAIGLPEDALEYVLERGSLPDLRLDSRVNLQFISSHLSVPY